jgi:hypothetical protein
MNESELRTLATQLFNAMEPLLPYVDAEIESEHGSEATDTESDTESEIESDEEPDLRDTGDEKEIVVLPDTLEYQSWQYEGDVRNVIETPRGIMVTFPKGGYSARAGINLKCTPFDLFPARDITVKYQVFVPKSFDFVKGGKLPGVTLGSKGTGGRNWKKNQGSVRLMFRPEGVVTGYLYICEDVGRYDGPKSPLMKAQGDGLEDIVHHSNGAGLYIWRHEETPMQLRRGWNNIRIRVKLNSPGKKDGRLVVKVNNVKKSFDEFQGTKRPDRNQIGKFQFSAWMGGGSKTYAPDHDQFLVFRDVTIVKRA